MPNIHCKIRVRAVFHKMLERKRFDKNVFDMSSVVDNLGKGARGGILSPDAKDQLNVSHASKSRSNSPRQA